MGGFNKLRIHVTTKFIFIKSLNIRKETPLIDKFRNMCIPNIIDIYLLPPHHRRLCLWCLPRPPLLAIIEEKGKKY